jgi:hypothetical protein
VNFTVSEQAVQPLPKNLPCACTHSRMISYCVSVEEQKTGKVRCVECEGVIPDPHLQREANGA